jgi:hypothetical protein
MPGYDPLDSQADPFRPPAIPTLVGCLHCGEEYDSYRIEWRVEQDRDGRPHGFWCCPIDGCDGRGFGFDIFPVDPDYRDENGERMWVEDEGEDLDDSDEEPPADDGQGPGKTPGDDQPLPW